MQTYMIFGHVNFITHHFSLLAKSCEEAAEIALKTFPGYQLSAVCLIG